MAKTTQKRKEELVPMKLPKSYKYEGATSKYPEYTDTKVFDYIPEVLVA
jgi:hypothetical protein